MNSLVFEGQAVRLIDRDGVPWWILADVCRALDIGNPSDVAKRLDSDERDTLDSIEGPTIISEPGLYKVIMKSRKPVAKRFDRWVRHEVLPTIRKTGSYGTPSLVQVAEMMVDGMKQAIAPLGLRLEGQDRAIERIERRQDLMAEDVASIKIRLLSGRKRLKGDAKAEHIDAIHQLGGRCPCGCGKIIVIGGVKLSDAEFDHFYSVDRADVGSTWLIHKDCHREFTGGKRARHDFEAAFRAYHHARLRLPGREPKFL